MGCCPKKTVCVRIATMRALVDMYKPNPMGTTIIYSIAFLFGVVTVAMLLGFL